MRDSCVTSISKLRHLMAVPALALALLFVGAAPQAQAAQPQPWQVVKTSDFAQYDTMSAVTAAGPRNAWAFAGNDLHDQVMAQHWNGRTWRDAAVPAGLPGDVREASATSASNVWAVGDSDSASRGSYALRWNGRAWVVAHRWDTGVVSGVTAVGRDKAWVFSDNRRDAGVGTWYFNGRRWTEVRLPYSLERAGAVSPRDIWAIGNDSSNSFKVVAHYDGTAWTRVPTGDALPDDIWGGEGEPSQQVFLTDVVAVSATEVWVTGTVWRSDDLGATPLPVVARWDGERWQKVDAPGNWQPRVAASDGRGGLWISGDGAPRESGRDTPVLMHRSSDGTWTSSAVQAGDRTAYVDGLALVPRTTTLWGVGQLRPADESSSDGAIFRQG
ncbi:hypothetical protein SAMN05443665_10406 [Actinomadura meyerae]|uniref:Uncharacterized protein n=1 Tax=Actinomadura meyerae TaxID=240840 RepID=A0A239NE34_9ACTN|nr:hypothetical protein [Actinomadura meyerae]SNT53227.1 hypothetical protein SAMN05443665_10406 [Actinomadura meyerae]